MLNNLWRRKTSEQVAEEEFLEGWNGVLESEKDRSNMSPAQLAIRLSKCKKNSPAYILYEHELNLAIVRVQNKPQYLAIIMTFVGLFIGWGLTQCSSNNSPSTVDIIKAHDFPAKNKICSKNTAEKTANTPSEMMLTVATPINQINDLGTDKKENSEPK